MSDLTDDEDVIFGRLDEKYDSGGRNLQEIAFTADYNDLTNIELVELDVTYTDNTTETIKVLKYTGT
jgi:hypothetical protein